MDALRFFGALDGRGLRAAVAFGAADGCALISKYYALIAGRDLPDGRARSVRARGAISAPPRPISPSRSPLAFWAPHLWWLAKRRAAAALSRRVSGRGFARDRLLAASAALGSLLQTDRRRRPRRGGGLARAARCMARRLARTAALLAILALAPLALSVAAALLLRTKLSPTC